MVTHSEEVKKLTLHLINSIAEYQKKHDAERGVALALDFLSSFIASITIGVVDGTFAATKDEDLAIQSFKAMKGAIQESVASGIAGAMTVFNGEKVDYYCEITLAPEPVNKYPV